MRYFGGKQKISKPLSEFLNSKLKDDQTFIDAFCGSCNVISKIDTNRVRIANDKHKYLVSMWNGLKGGYELPQTLTKEQYEDIKSNKDLDPILTGFVGFGCSFAGKWFGGFASSSERDYCKNAYNSVTKKFQMMKDVAFTNKDYTDIDLPSNSFIYCDIPYRNTTPYCKDEVGVFDHERFYSWCKEKIYEGHVVFVSEYLQNVPEDATIVWSHKSKKDIRDKNGVQQPTTEVLFTWGNANE